MDRPVPLVIERHPHVSWRARALAAGVQAVLTPAIRRMPRGPIDFHRAASLDRLARRARPPRGSRVERVRLEDFHAEWVHGPGVGRDRSRVILYFHGGGWISCGLNTHRRMIAHLSGAAGIPALSVAYRMLPEVTFAEEALDCLAAYRWLLEQGVAPRDIVMSGDSAGGYLTFATALLAREDGLPLPAGLIALSPMLDMDLAAKTAHPNAELDRVSLLPLLDAFVAEILGGLDPLDPKVSPVRADLRGLPPSYLCCSSSEVLACDSETMAERLAAAGVPTRLQTWAGQLHVFQMFGSALPESKAAIATYGEWTRDALSRAREKEQAA